MTVIAPERAKLGYGLGTDEGEAFWLLGMLETIKIGGEDTGGQFGLARDRRCAPAKAPPGTSIPRRTSGSTSSRESSLSTSATHELTLAAGGFAFGPKGVPHTFIAGPEGGKALVGFAPFQFEGFLREIGEPAPERVLPPPLHAPPDMARLLPDRREDGMEILGPPGPPPGR